MIDLNRIPLTEADLDKFRGSYIPLELANQAGLFRVDSRTGAQIVGRNGGGDYTGIVFPYFLPGESEPREYRLRRDIPDREQKSDGSIKEVAKYLSPPGRGNMLYFVPDTSPAWLQDTSLPIVITEGEKKTLALFVLAFHSVMTGATPRFLPVGIPGVWNWRSRNVGKTEDAGGNRVDLKGVIPDLDRIAWQGRTVHIIFDANVATNESVRVARRELARELTGRGSIVRYVNLPIDSGCNGVDDLLGAKGTNFVLDLIANAISADDLKAKRHSQTSDLLSIADSLCLFHFDNEGFASLPVNEHREHVALKSKAFRRWLSQQFFNRTSGAPSSQPLQDAIETLQGKALFASEECKTFRRVAHHGGKLCLDLCNDQWQAVEISADGWQVVNNPPVVFLRSNGMRALPTPEKGGSLDELRHFINAGSDENFELVKAWLANALRYHTPFPVLIFHGEQGSAKSTTARVLRALIDPNLAPLRSEPREERDLVAAVSNGWVVALDNLSRVPVWLSDALCRVSTGGGFGARKLFTDEEEVLIDAMRPVIITGIEEVATRGDLLDRALILYLPSISEERRREEREFWLEFERARPRLLGALCDAVSQALRNISHTKLSRKPRMADFATWAVAAEGVGEGESRFLKAYWAMRNASNELALEASPLSPLIRQFAEQHEIWLGTAAQLHKELYDMADEQTRKHRSFPANGRVLSNKLRSLAPDLRGVGVNVQFGVRLNRASSRGIQIEWIGNVASVSPASSASEGKLRGFNGSDADVIADAKLNADAMQTQANYLLSTYEIIKRNGLDDIGANADDADAKYSDQSVSDSCKRVVVKI